MIYVRMMPWKLRLGEPDYDLDCALYAVDPTTGFKCEFHNDPAYSECSPQPFAFGTSDPNEPKFCFKHYFEGCTGDGVGDYKFIPYEK